MCLRIKVKVNFEIYMVDVDENVYVGDIFW